MKIINLKRISFTTDGTFGVMLFENGDPFCVTVELPWRNNEHNVSHIPCGEYLCERAMSPARGYEVYWVKGVPNRADIEIHIGNSIHDIVGCIAIGHGFGVVETKDTGSLWGIQESKAIFALFMARLKNDPQFKLVITEPR